MSEKKWKYVIWVEDFWKYGIIKLWNDKCSMYLYKIVIFIRE